MIINISYKRTRPARFNDVQSILEILGSPVQHAAVVLRTVSYIEQQIDNYLVFCVVEDVVDVAKLLIFRTVPLQKFPVWQLLNCIEIQGSAVN